MVLKKLSNAWKRRTDIAEADILHHLGVNPRLLENLLEEGVDDEVEWSVFEAAFAGFRQGRPYGERDDYIVRVLLGSVKCLARAMGSRAGEGGIHCREPALAGSEVAED